MLILIDQDGPLADFEQGFLNIWQKLFPQETFIPLEERKTFYMRQQYPTHLIEKVDSVYSAPGFFRNLEPTKGAIEAIKSLTAQGHDIRICTSPLSHYENCVLEKFEWVEKYFGRDFTKRIILTKDKTMVRGDLLIDDKPEVKGVFTPTWEHILFDYPYNKHVAEKRRLNWDNWQKIINSNLIT
ncbi:MAG: 5'-3'-deoxyribonucleotidase [Acidobacteria bacterium]|nr:5'-3'-deoxyribonucleotidase [Acidobacteriota bacterium]